MPKVTYLLFTTTTCPKCPAMKAWVAEHLAWCPGAVLDNASEDFLEKAQAHGVTAAPTFLLFEADDAEPLLRTDEVSILADYFADYKPA